MEEMSSTRALCSRLALRESVCVGRRREHDGPAFTTSAVSWHQASPSPRKKRPRGDHHQHPLTPRRLLARRICLKSSCARLMPSTHKFGSKGKSTTFRYVRWRDPSPKRSMPRLMAVEMVVAVARRAVVHRTSHQAYHSVQCCDQEPLQAASARHPILTRSSRVPPP